MAYRSSAIASAATGAITATPVGVQVGDYLCGLFDVDSPGVTVTLPSGWVQRANPVNSDQSGFYADKIATGTDSFQFNGTTALARALVTAAWSGRDTNNPLSTAPVTTVDNVANLGNGFTATYNGITASQGDDIAVFFFTDQSDAGMRMVSTQITNYTERQDGVATDWVSGIGVDTRDNVNAGATGNLTATLSDTNTLARTSGYGAVVVAIKAASGSQGPLTAAKPLLMTLQRDASKLRAMPIPSYTRDFIPPDVVPPRPGNTAHPILATFERRFGRMPMGRPAIVGSDASINGTASISLGALTLTSPDGTVLVTGTGTINLGALTLTTDADVFIVGDGTVNLGALTTTTDVDVVVQGSLNTTFGALTLTGVAAVLVQGTFNQTFGALTLSATGVAPIAGTGAINLGALTLTTDGDVFIVGDSTIGLGALTLTTDVDVLVQGAATLSFGALTLTADGTVTTPGSDVNGTANFTLDALTLTGAAVVLVTGSAAITLDALTLSATGAISVTGNASLNLGALTLSADGIASTINGDANLTLGALTLSSTGTSGGVVTSDTSGGPDRLLEDEYIEASAKAARRRYPRSGQVPGELATPGTQVAEAGSPVAVEPATSVKGTEVHPAADPGVIAAFDVLAEQFARERVQRMKVAAAIAAALSVLEEEEV